MPSSEILSDPCSRLPNAPPTIPVEQGPRLRTIGGNPLPRKFACGCGGQLPGDPQSRYVLDFGGR